MSRVRSSDSVTLHSSMCFPIASVRASPFVCPSVRQSVLSVARPIRSSAVPPSVWFQHLPLLSLSSALRLSLSSSSSPPPFCVVMLADWLTEGRRPSVQPNEKGGGAATSSQPRLGSLCSALLRAACIAVAWPAHTASRTRTMRPAPLHPLDVMDMADDRDPTIPSPPAPPLPPAAAVCRGEQTSGVASKVRDRRTATSAAQTDHPPTPRSR